MDDAFQTDDAARDADPMAAALDHLPHGFALFDPAGAMLRANTHFTGPLLGVTAAPSRRLDLMGCLGPGAGRGRARTLLEGLETARSEGRTGEISDVTLEGCDSARHRLKLFLQADGHVTALLTALTASTPQNRTAREIFGDAIDMVNFGVALIDEGQRLVFANQKFRANCDPNNELLVPGHTMRQIHADAIRTGLFPLPEGWMADDLLDLMDRLIDCNARDFPVPNNHGAALVGNVYGTELGGRILTIQDLTQERQAEKLMVAAMERLPVGVAIEDAQGNFTHCNAAFAAPYGVSAEALTRMAPADRVARLAPQIATLNNEPVSDANGADFANAVAAQRVSLAPFEVRFTSGQHFLAERARTENEGRVVVVTDITALKDAETRNMAAVTDAVQSLDVGVVLFDKDLTILFGNDKWSEMFARGAQPVRIGDHAIDALRRQVAEGFYRLAEGQNAEQFVAALQHAIGTYATNVPLEFSDGRSFIASCHKTRLDGHLISFIETTEQRLAEAELQRQREITQQKERLSALGELLASVAHELNNPLSIIVGYAQMLEDRIADPVLQRRVDRIAEAAQRSSKIVEMFLDMARERPFETAPCQLNEIVESALDVAESGLLAEFDVDLALQDPLPEIAGDPDQLIQVVYNLITNARQAVESRATGGRLMIRTTCDPARAMACVEVADNGPGVPDDLRHRIFEPLFSTKEVGDGTGMGLALCHRIVTGHGGSISLAESPLGGAAFVVALPLAETGSGDAR